MQSRIYSLFKSFPCVGTNFEFIFFGGLVVCDVFLQLQCIMAREPSTSRSIRWIAAF